MGHRVCVFWVPTLPLTRCLALLVPERECRTWQGARLSGQHPSLLPLPLLLVLGSLLPAGHRQVLVNCLCSCILPLDGHRHWLGLGRRQLGWLGVQHLGWLGVRHLHMSSSWRALLNGRANRLGLGCKGGGLLTLPGWPTLVLLSRRRSSQAQIARRPEAMPITPYCQHCWLRRMLLVPLGSTCRLSTRASLLGARLLRRLDIRQIAC